jgi:hypothetical protein
MIPLMMQQGFKAKGWLGLILGQSVYHAFYPNAVPTDETFMQRMDALIREIGDRGKIKTRVSEGVPPRAHAPRAHAPAPAPAPARAPAPAPAFEPTPEPAPARVSTPAASVPTTPSRALAPASTLDRGFSPSLQPSSSMPMVQHIASTGGGSSLSEMSSFFKELREEAKAERAELTLQLKQQQKEMEARLDAKDVKMEQQRTEADAKMEQQRKEMETKIAELTPGPPSAAIADEQLAALQARIEGLHVTKLLTDEELFALEDLVADYVELTMSVADRVITRDTICAMPAASKLDKLVGLSAAMAGDAAFARQARRKFL